MNKDSNKGPTLVRYIYAAVVYMFTYLCMMFCVFSVIHLSSKSDLRAGTGKFLNPLYFCIYKKTPPVFVASVHVWHGGLPG